jgi:hypothetical protein
MRFVIAFIMYDNYRYHNILAEVIFIIVIDDTTNIHLDRRPNNYDGPRGWM